jgi:short-subunit dehydrogenase
MKELNNKNCFITGAASGIGKAFALALAKEGMNIFITDIDIQNLNKVKNELEDLGTQVYHFKCDVSKFDDFQNAATEYYSKFDELDLLINNAGITIGGNILALTLEDWKKVLDTNLWSVIYSLKAFLSKLIEQGYGHIVNVASGAGILGAGDPPPYVASKSAVIGLTEALFGQLKKYGITASVIVPAYIKTNIYQNAKVKYHPKLLEAVGRKKLDEISNNILREMKDKAMSPDRAVKNYIKGIKRNQLFIYENKSILKSLVMKGENQQKYQDFLVKLCKLKDEQIRKHFLEYGIDIEKYY